jgi:hypothetical protein
MFTLDEADEQEVLLDEITTLTFVQAVVLYAHATTNSGGDPLTVMIMIHYYNEDSSDV